jgi:hypothetical protein
MFDFRWWKCGGQPPAREWSRVRKRLHCRPFLEALEDRLVLSTAVTTTANSASAVFNTRTQSVSLSASVNDVSKPADMVNHGGS